MVTIGRFKMSKIRETDLKDRRGNIVISPGLKVRHKKSQFEYTVDSVVQDRSGKIVILLKKPDVGRFDAASKKSPKRLVDRGRNPPVIYEVDPIEDFSTSYYAPGEEEPVNQDDRVAISVKEFEKDYEVK